MGRDNMALGIGGFCDRRASRLGQRVSSHARAYPSNEKRLLAEFSESWRTSATA